MPSPVSRAIFTGASVNIRAGLNSGMVSMRKGNKVYVLFSNKNADGTVVIDTVLFVPE